MIESCSFGRLRAAGREFREDLILFGPGVEGEGETWRSGWRRKTGHALDPADLGDVLEARPDFLVIGRGAHGRMAVPEETLSRLRDAGVEPVAPATTAEAVTAYNALVERGARVAGAFHLTC